MSGALQISRSTSLATYKVSQSTQSTKDKNFLQAEELGVGQPRGCDSCKHCVRCSHRAEHMTRREAAELVMIEQNVTVDPANKCVRIRYPTKGDLCQMRDNRGQAIACAAALERKLSCDKTREI